MAHCSFRPTLTVWIMDATRTGTHPMILDIDRLRTGLAAALDLAVERFGNSVDLRQFPTCKDYYWQLAPADAFSMRDNIATEVTAGLTSDDLDELDEMLANPGDQALWHSLEHLSELLRLLAALDADR